MRAGSDGEHLHRLWRRRSVGLALLLAEADLLRPHALCNHNANSAGEPLKLPFLFAFRWRSACVRLVFVFVLLHCNSQCSLRIHIVDSLQQLFCPRIAACWPAHHQPVCFSSTLLASLLSSANFVGWCGQEGDQGRFSGCQETATSRPRQITGQLCPAVPVMHGHKCGLKPECSLEFAMFA